MAWAHEQMAARAAKELHGGDYVNLGVRAEVELSHRTD